jgi:hypothetical protein
MIVAPFVLLSLGWAQRGGGFHGGASSGGMRAGGFRGGFHGGAPGSFVRAPQSGFHSGNGFHHPNHGPNLIIGTRRFHGGFRRGWYGAYPYYGWYSPYYWDWSSSSYDSQPNNDLQYQTMNEVNRLAGEVQELREERETRSAPSQPAPQPQQPAKLQQQPEDLPVVLVFLDKRIQEVKNYAVANEMLVVLDGNRRKKYPLADIDLAATMKLNDERGVDFEVPNPVITQ